MALTVYQQPEELTPAYNKQVFVALSDQIYVTGFKYVVTVIVNGDTANIYTQDIIQRPDGRMVFDAMEWVKNYIEHYFNPDINLASPIEIATNKTVSVEVSISESGVSPIDSETITYQAFDACLTEDDFDSYDFTDYTFNNASAFHFLHKTISTITPDPRITLTQDLWLHFVQNPAAPVSNIVIELKRLGVVIQTISISTLPTVTYSYDTFVMQVAPKLFTSPLVGDVVHVKFYESGSPSNVLLLDWNYTIQSICSKFTDYVLYYLDRDGNILPFHFEYKSTQSYTKKTNEVKLEKSTLNTTTNQYGSKSWNRAVHEISNTTESTITVNTGWITESQSLALLDLFDSPIRYVWDGTKLKSCKITNNGFDVKLKVNEKLFNYECTIDLGITETRQRGI